ncbi:hypothetical protein G9Q38_09455 [Pusillimonas sp. DMV24BSW_D]|nr:hypothetical protein G9Q38_09455 [Pusillimonas sp. DMV24BSW_D]
MAGLITQTLIVHLIRTEKRPFVESKASLPLALGSVGIVAVGIFLPMGPLASYFKFQSLPLSYFFALAVIMALYAWSVQRVKAVYMGRYC